MSVECIVCPHRNSRERYNQKRGHWIRIHDRKLLLKRELGEILQDANVIKDRERAEIVLSVKHVERDCWLLKDLSDGDVLFQARGYMHPTLARIIPEIAADVHQHRRGEARFAKEERTWESQTTDRKKDAHNNGAADRSQRKDRERRGA